MNFESIYKNYWDKVFKFTHNYTSNYHEQEELTQDILYNVFLSLKKFKNKSDIGTYIYAIARNKCVDYINNNKKNKKKIEKMISIHEINYENNPLDSYLMNENVNYFLSILNKLSVENREVFYLSEVENIKYKDIGKILNIPIGTVKSRLNRAKEKIIKLLDRGN